MNYNRILEVLKQHEPYFISGFYHEITLGYSKRNDPAGKQKLWLQVRPYNIEKGAFPECIWGYLACDEELVCDEEELKDTETFISKLNELIGLATKNFKDRLLEDLDLEE